MQRNFHDELSSSALHANRGHNDFSPATPSNMAADSAALTHALRIEAVRVRDLCIPLGGFINVVAVHSAPLLPGPSGAVRKKVRSTPPVLLPRHGEVALPRSGCSREFSCEASQLLPVLSHEPLLVELWHHDKYTQDVLLGVASVDLSEVLSTRPTAAGGGRPGGGGAATVHRQEQTVAVIAPEEGLLPAALAPDTMGGGGRRVALLDVNVELEVGSSRAPAPSKAPAHGQAASASSPRTPPASRRRAGGTDVAAVRATAHAELAAWRRREEEKWRAQLAKKEEERLEMLTREWKVHEARRVAESRAQARSIAEVTRELKNKLSQLLQQEAALEHAAEQLSLKGVAMETEGQARAAEAAAAAQREICVLQSELHTTRTQLSDAEGRVSAYQRRSEALFENEAKAATQATVWREAHATASTKAMALESDKGHLTAELEGERRRLQRLEEANHQAQLRAAEMLAAEANKPEPPASGATAAAAALAAAGLVEANEVAQLVGVEAEAVAARLRTHSRGLDDEGRQLRQLREELTAHARAPRRGGKRGAEPLAAITEVPSGDGGDTSGGGGGAVQQSPSASLRGRGAGVGSVEPDSGNYSLRSLVESLDAEESWWEKYQRDVLAPSSPGGGVASGRMPRKGV